MNGRLDNDWDKKGGQFTFFPGKAGTRKSETAPLFIPNKAATRTGRIRNAQSFCCRCFLPDLTGFTGLRRAGPGPDDTGYPSDSNRWKTGLRKGLLRPYLFSRQLSVFSLLPADDCQLPTISGGERGIIRASSPHLCEAALASLRRSNPSAPNLSNPRGFSYLSLLSSIVSLQFTAY